MKPSKTQTITRSISIPIFPEREKAERAAAVRSVILRREREKLSAAKPQGAKDLDKLDEAKDRADSIARVLGVTPGSYDAMRASFNALMQVLEGNLSPSELRAIKETPGATVEGYLAARKNQQSQRRGGKR